MLRRIRIRRSDQARVDAKRPNGLQSRRSGLQNRYSRVRLPVPPPPAAVPAIFAGLRIGLGRALAGMVIVELILVAIGLGKLLLIFQARQEPEFVYATVFFVLAEALLLLEVARFIERKAAPWNG